MDTKHICYLLIGIIGFSCTDVKREIKNDYVLEVLPDKCFELDDYTVQNCYCLQYIPRNDWFCFSNTPDNSITINDFKTGKLIKKIHFSKEGNNGVGSVSSFYLADTLVYLHHHWNRKVYITDTTAKVVNKISIDLEKFIAKGITPPSILPQISSPIQIAKNKLILMGYQIPTEKEIENKENMPSTVLYNFAKQDFELTNGYPLLYQKGAWGNNLRIVDYTLNDKQEMVVSFPASDSIFVNDLEGNIHSYYAGVPDGNHIKPIYSSRSPKYYSQNEELKHYMSNTVYGGIFYDPIQEIYYRFVTLPTEINQDEKENPYNKKLQILILDKSYQTVGLIDLPHYVYWTNSIFLSKEGLHIQVPSDNDDIMRFKTFKVRRIQA